MDETHLLSGKGDHEIGLRIWRPEGDVSGVVQLLHGMGEHIDRYVRFARAANQRGIVVCAHNHRGHGGPPRGSAREPRSRKRSSSPTGTAGIFSSTTRTSSTNMCASSSPTNASCCSATAWGRGSRSRSPCTTVQNCQVYCSPDQAGRAGYRLLPASSSLGSRHCASASAVRAPCWTSSGSGTSTSASSRPGPSWTGCRGMKRKWTPMSRILSAAGRIPAVCGSTFSAAFSTSAPTTPLAAFPETCRS